MVLNDVKTANMEEEEQPVAPAHPLPENDPTRTRPRTYPQVVKYMGSKASILDFISDALQEVEVGDRPIIDLFAGACAISGGFGHCNKIISNDIQQYSAVIASTYLKRAERIGQFDLISMASEIALPTIAALPANLQYSREMSLPEFNKVEARNRQLIYQEFAGTHHLFTRVYSGTWWSAEQCVWIDAFREVLDTLYAAGEIAEQDFNFGLTCLLHSMAYSSQGTGHYAQYRDAKTETGMVDICKYRLVSVPSIFSRKFDSLLSWNLSNVVDLGHELIARDYRECLASAEPSVVYADPPYAFVHYSRFYHAMETIVEYDYPEIQHVGGKLVKGRYRVNRHQSPFCIKTQVRGAFSELFDGIVRSGSDMLLSYSNTGMIGIDELIKLAQTRFGPHHVVSVEHMDHTHMTMGRKDDRSREVTESLIIAKRL